MDEVGNTATIIRVMVWNSEYWRSNEKNHLLGGVNLNQGWQSMAIDKYQFLEIEIKTSHHGVL